uniref:Acetyl-coenzyme A carboxylase carboxyl transferase subunit beta, chloroplastic n=8 Tax=rosids TaxID=71275 RepID=A0A9E7BWU2_9ROSI|nr:acetyl-CoA carboxylase carboxyltransferase beta subunit [Euphorbia neogillettii]UED19874.1 acetyl-CoA carboxylase carboxyltransferase beta subunit [Euphorbia neogillettii]
MEKWWFNSILSNVELGYRCRLGKSMDSFNPFENTSISEDPILNDTDKHIHSWSNSDNLSSSNVDHLVGVRDILDFSVDETFLVQDSKKDSYSIYFDIENKVFEIETDYSFLGELESSFSSYWSSSYLNNGSRIGDSQYDHYMYDTNYSWNNYINSCIDRYLRSQICIDSSIFSGSNYYSESYIYSYICSESENSSENESTSLITSTNVTDLVIRESSNDLDRTQNYKHLWVQCENCYELNYKRFLKSKMNVCEECGYHLKMNSSDRIELLIDPATWDPMDEDMVSLDTIQFDSDKLNSDEFNSEEELNSDELFDEIFDELNSLKLKLNLNSDEFSSDELNSLKLKLKLTFNSSKLNSDEFNFEEETYKDRIDSYQIKTGLTEAVQTGTGQLNGIPVAVGVMDFQFIGGSMGSVVGEKITRLIEYATNQFLPLILVCASGGARMQEGSLSLMQMAKISSALYDYQSNKKLFYVSILTSPTTGGVTASFGMLGDIIIAEPNAYIAFAGKRVIEQTLNKEVPEGSQSAEFLFDKGVFDSIVPRNLLKGVLNELLQLHDFFPLNLNQVEP